MSEDIVGLEVKVAVVVEAVAVGDLPVDAPDGEVYLRKPSGRVVQRLTVNRDVAPDLAAVPIAGGVRADELG